MVTKPRGDPLSPRLNGPARCPIVALKTYSRVKSTLFLSTTVNENVKKLILTVLLLLTAPWVQAQLQIEIISGNASALPIAIVPFKWEETSPPPITGVAEIVAGDLYRSGLFDPLEEDDMAGGPPAG